MASKKLRGICAHVYMLAVCAFLMWDIAFMTEAQWTFGLREAFPGVWYGLAAAALLMMRFRPGPAVLPLGFLAWMAASSAWRGIPVLEAQAEEIARGVLAFAVILPAPRVVGLDRLIRYLKALLVLWTGFLTAQAAVGLWAALTGHAVFSLRGTWYIGVNLGDHRLYLNAYVTTGAVKMGLSVLLAAWGAAMSSRRLTRVLYALCGVVQLLCLSLTDCRTAFIAVGAGLGLMAMTALLHRGASVQQPQRRWLRAACALLAVPLLTAGTYLTLSRTLTALAPHVPQELDNITLLELPAHLLPEAAAEETQTVQHRGLDAGNLFNDRQLIWRASLRLLGHQPQYLLTGTTGELASWLTNLYILPEESNGRPFAHVHCIYLQVLVSWGVPGLLLLAAFLMLFLRAAWRVMLHHPLPLWQRFAPVPALYVMLCDTVDCFTRLSEPSPMLLFACLCAGVTLAVDERAKREAYASAQPQLPVDVIIPVYNAADYVARATASALACGATRVILIDDGSNDGSDCICDELSKKDERVTVLHQANRGASAARNAGLDMASAELVIFLDADDELLPGALAALTERIGATDAIQGCILRSEPAELPGKRVEYLAAHQALGMALQDPTRHMLCHGWLFRRQLLTERFDENLTMGEDGEWLLRTLLKAEKVAFCDVPAYRYTVRADSVLHGGAADVNEQYLRTLTAAEDPLTTADMPAQAAVYRLTHLLLLMTHGDLEAALHLRDIPLFDEAFRQARLSGLSPRMLTLRLLRARWYGMVRLIVRLRRRWNSRR